MIQPLELLPEHALFEGKVKGLVVSCFQNERPLQGLIGLLDWRFQGAISEFLQAGALSGKEGECVYLPLQRGGRSFHLFSAGFGTLNRKNHHAEQVSPDSWKNLKKNLLSLRIQEVALSRSDMGIHDLSWAEKKLEGVPLWITP